VIYSYITFFSGKFIVADVAGILKISVLRFSDVTYAIIIIIIIIKCKFCSVTGHEGTEGE
jgi:hypothetical protein